MKVRAKHWINYNGTWRMSGEVFTISDDDAAEMAQYTEAVETEPEHAAEPEAEPIKRGRKRKIEE